jgi:hypothetical protein
MYICLRSIFKYRQTNREREREREREEGRRGGREWVGGEERE